MHPPTDRIERGTLALASRPPVGEVLKKPHENDSDRTTDCNETHLREQHETANDTEPLYPRIHRRREFGDIAFDKALT